MGRMPTKYSLDTCILNSMCYHAFEIRIKLKKQRSNLLPYRNNSRIKFVYSYNMKYRHL